MKERVYQGVIAALVVSLGTVVYFSSQEEKTTSEQLKVNLNQDNPIQQINSRYQKVDIQAILDQQAPKTTQTKIEIAAQVQELEESFQKSLSMIKEYNENNPDNQIIVGDLFNDATVENILPQTSYDTQESYTDNSVDYTTPAYSDSSTDNSDKAESLASASSTQSTFSNTTITSSSGGSSSSTTNKIIKPEDTPPNIYKPEPEVNPEDSMLKSYQTSINEIQQVLKSLNQSLN